jgi:hypothetical protein
MSYAQNTSVPAGTTKGQIEAMLVRRGATGYGDGSGDKGKYFSALLAPHQKPHTVAAFWRSTKTGEPANGGTGTKAVIGLEEVIPGPLKLCGNRALHATINPPVWKGERWWIVALHEPVQHADNKLGSLKRTFLVDLGTCPFTN